MKKIMLIVSIIAITAITFFACSEREHSNPLDYEWGKVEPIQSLNLESISIYEIKLSWTADANYPEGHQYRIDKKVGSNGWVERYKILWGNEDSSYVDTVEINQKILYRIYVTYDKNKSIEKIDSLINIFPPPTNFAVTQSSIISANLSWTDNSIGEDKFEIERKLSTESTYLKIGEITGSDTATKNWTDQGLSANLTYDYRVRGVKGSYNSNYLTKTGYLNEFRALANLTITSNSITSATLSWPDNYIGEDKYEIERKLSTESTYNKVAEVIGSDTASKSWTDNTLVPGLNYNYRVRIIDGTAYSNYAAVNLTNPFQAPTSFTLTQNNVYTFTLKWKNNSIGEAGFKIERKIDDGVYSVIATVTDTTFVDATVLKKGYTTVYYKVRAYKGTYYSAYTENNSSILFPAPTNLTYTKENIYTIKLNWLETSNGEDGFKIDKKIGTASWITGFATVGANIKTWTDSNGDINTNLQYRVYAYKGINSTQAIVTAVIDNSFPAPTSLTASGIDGTSIKLNWTDNSTGESGFKIDRKAGSSGSWVTNYASVGSNIKTWTDTGITVGIPYTYKIRAYYSTYYSNYSSEVSASIIDLTRFLSIPTGSFSMGSTTGYSDEQPIHKVNITRDYYLCKYEVTQKEWTTIMGDISETGYGVGDNYPVYNVSWYSILKYCNLKSMAEGLTPCYSIGYSTDPTNWGDVPTSSNITWDEVTCNWNANGYRLPTEAEWEYAARYNDGRTYPWGTDAPNSSLCNYNNNVGLTKIVGSYPYGNSKLGLCDMAGNVWEQVWDWYEGTYSSNIQTDPTGSKTGDNRVIRGGSWYHEDVNIRCAVREFCEPFNSIDDVGFRIARTNTVALSITPISQFAGNNSGSFKYSITYNDYWSASVDQSWCSIVNPTGNGNDSLQVNYEANTGDTYRLATITVTGSGFSKKATLTQYSSIPRQGLVAYYPFNGNSNDESGYDNHGIATDAELTNDRFGNFNEAYYFNGNNSQITAQDENGIPFGSSDFTVFAWVMVTQPISSDYRFIIGNCVTDEFQFILNPSDDASVAFYIGGDAIVSENLVWNSEEWYTLAIVRSGTNFTLYRNGIGIVSKIMTADNNAPLGSRNMTIGKRYDGNHPWKGGLDEIRIYNRALTETEVKQLFVNKGVKK